MTLNLTEGRTAVLDFQLKCDGVPHDLTGLTVVLVLKKANGSSVSASTEITDAATGKVRYSPASNDLVASGTPYSAHWKVTEAGKDMFFPNGKADVWNVYAQ